MMGSPSELGFDCKPQIYSMLMKSFGDLANEQTQKLEEFLARLEEEKLKIDAFKRELPLCMHLITNAMEASRQQLQSHRTNQSVTKPVLEEFIPLKTNTGSSTTDYEQPNNNISSDKANWMTSAQLWNQQSESTTKNPTPQSIITSSDQETEIKLGLNGKQRMNGAFHPFSTSKDSRGSSEVYPELALVSLHNKEEIMEDNKDTSEMRENSVKYNNSCEKEMMANTSQSQSQSQRKARRCWSPDLHRRFVNALHMLGGSQVATPKQIRELMKVDGLTNDEVKSHLQKYRLHTRRPSPSPQTAVTAAPQVVVLGGIWVPPEYAAAAAHGGGLYGAHAATTHPSFCSPPPPQEMYPAIAAPPPPPLPLPPNHQLHHHHHHQQQQQLHIYSSKAPSSSAQGNTSPESGMEGGGAGDPSESIEDGKSESGSWKADSGGAGGDRRRLDGEESVVSLKF